MGVNRRINVRENSKGWDEEVPSDIMPAIKDLRERFDDAHWQFGRLTQVLCFSRLHNGDVKEVEEYLRPLQDVQVMVGSAATQRFHELLGVKTPPAGPQGILRSLPGRDDAGDPLDLP